MTDEVPVDSIDENTAAIEDAVSQLRADYSVQARANRWLRTTVLVGLILAIVDLVGLGFILEASVQSRDNGRDIKNVLSIVDPRSARGHAAAVAQSQYRASFLVEEDCWNRRAIAHLPPPPPPKPDGTLVPCEMPPKP